MVPLLLTPDTERQHSCSQAHSFFKRAFLQLGEKEMSLDVFMLQYWPEQTLDQRKCETHPGISLVRAEHLLMGSIYFGHSNLEFFIHTLLQSLQMLFVNKNIG